MNLQRLVCTLIIITTMVLAGCGGGGGGGSMSSMDQMGGNGGGGGSMPDSQQPPAQQPGDGTMPSVSVFGDLSATQEEADNIVAVIGQAARATPRAGSVTQSSNVNSNGVTTDQVEVTTAYSASGPRFAVRNGTAWSFAMGEGNPEQIEETTPPWKGAELSKRVTGGTVYVAAYSDIKASTTQQSASAAGGVGSIVAPGQSIRYEGGGNMFTFTVRPDGFGCFGVGICAGQGLNISRFSARKNADGNWEILALPSGAMPVSGGTQTVTVNDTDYLSGGVWLVVPTNTRNADGYTFGVFGDGNDPFMQANLMPLTGSATYRGNAVGVYAEKTATTTALGEFEGDVALTANFGGASDLGTISGAITNFVVDGEPDTGRLNLGTAAIGSQNSGFFEGAVTGADSERTYVGNWGGQFFGNGESDGRPGSVGGTFGGNSTDDAVNFVGVFGAYKQ